jgi:branched-chain amino acid aminotransferase
MHRMNEPIAFRNGSWIPAGQATISPTDAGFVLGATLSEQLRTFGGELFHLEDHLCRLRQSLRVVGIDPGLDDGELAAAAVEIVAHNHRLLNPGDDLGLSILATPGTYASYSAGETAGPLLLMHTYPLPFHLWAAKYETGQACVIPEVRQVPPECWPRSLKCRSRMHYYLADRRAAEIEPGARAILLDRDGFLTEASTANVVLHVPGEGLVSPPRERILPGISLAVLRGLAARLGIAATERDVTPEDARGADEILLTSTPSCVLPVTRFSGRPVGLGTPGDVFQALLAAWSELAGVDIAGQARRLAGRR